MRHDHLLRNLGLSLVLSVACVSAGSTAGSADDSLRAALQSRYADMKAALAAHDAAALTAIFAPDFVSVDVSGQSKGGSQVIADVNALKPDPNKTSETTLISIIPGANAVTVEQRYDMKTVRTAADGTKHNKELVALSTDSWVKPADAWLIQRTVTNELSFFNDGQLILHKLKP
jgi:ketosteroid isomerase-like protein